MIQKVRNENWKVGYLWANRKTGYPGESGVTDSEAERSGLGSWRGRTGSRRLGGSDRRRGSTAGLWGEALVYD